MKTFAVTETYYVQAASKEAVEVLLSKGKRPVTVEEYPQGQEDISWEGWMGGPMPE